MLKDDDYKRIPFRFAAYLAWTSLIHLIHGQTFISDEEFIILVTFEPKKDPGFSFPCEANPEFDFDENAVFAKPVSLFSMVYTNILIDYS